MIYKTTTKGKKRMKEKFCININFRVKVLAYLKIILNKDMKNTQKGLIKTMKKIIYTKKINNIITILSKKIFSNKVINIIKKKSITAI
jgi:hypothetical protein